MYNIFSKQPKPVATVEPTSGYELGRMDAINGKKCRPAQYGLSDGERYNYYLGYEEAKDLR